MALSRIWSAFIIVAIVVAAVRSISGDKNIFNRMVVGRSSDPYDSVYYYGIGSPVNQGLAANYDAFLKEYGYVRTNDLEKATVVLSDDRSADSITAVKAVNPALGTYTYKSVQAKLER
ncbi:MAG: hypothetical protein EON98_09330, partial [Chitinophagaceae bacterium]